jgi:hypothetical protein
MRALSLVIALVLAAGCRTWPHQGDGGKGVLETDPVSPGSAAKPEAEPGRPEDYAEEAKLPPPPPKNP